MNLNFQYLFSLLLFISCNNSVSHENRNGDNANFTNNLSKYEYDLIENLEKIIGLQSILKGFDSVQIRIWGDHDERNTTNRIIIIQNNKGSWTGKLYYIIFVPRTGPEITIRNIDSLQLSNPKSGWSQLIANLTRYDLFNLPRLDTVTAYRETIDTGAFGYTIENADRYRYQSATYLDPYWLRDKFPEAENAIRIIERIEDEFNIQGKAK